jgi:hypothetical protein
MSWVKFAIAVVQLIATAVEWLKQQQWYQQGVTDANAQANSEQQARVDHANAARADADLFSNSKLHDPRDRDNAVH